MPILRAAHRAGVQVIWDLMHFGWPDGLDPFSAALETRLAGLARAFAALHRDETGHAPLVCPVNEVSFLSWCGAEVGEVNPFAEHRGYVAGDDIRRVDWRLYARTDRYYIKQYEADTNTNFTILMDVSRSMSFSSGGVTKLEYGAYLGACLGYLATRQRDRVGIITFDQDIVTHVPPPRVDAGPFKMLATLLDRDNFVGRVLTGRIASGKLTVNMPIRAIDGDGKVVEEGRATKIMAFRGLERVAVEEAEAGEIVAIAGLTTATVANTIADPSVAAPIHAQPIDPPTLAMTFSVNDSPMAGREGSKVTSRMIRDRLAREAEGNVSFHITESADKDAFEVAGRG